MIGLIRFRNALSAHLYFVSTALVFQSSLRSFPHVIPLCELYRNFPFTANIERTTWNDDDRPIFPACDCRKAIISYSTNSCDKDTEQVKINPRSMQ